MSGITPVLVRVMVWAVELPLFTTRSANVRDVGESVATAAATACCPGVQAEPDAVLDGLVEHIYRDLALSYDTRWGASACARASRTSSRPFSALARRGCVTDNTANMVQDDIDLALRYGVQPEGSEPVAYHESVTLKGGVRATYVPAGHVLGSAQILLEHAGERVVVTGDYKRRPDPTCLPFEPVPCDIFVTEATFGLPVFRHPDTGSEMDRLLHALHANPDRCVLVGAYALGKAQRVICELRARGYHDPIYIHGALERMCALYQDFGVDMGKLRGATGVAAKDLHGAIVLAPPSAIADRWSRRFADPIPAVCSGTWLTIAIAAAAFRLKKPWIW